MVLLSTISGEVHGGYNSDPSNNDTANLGQIGSTLPAGVIGAGDGNWGHFGDIAVRSLLGNIAVMGGSTILVSDRLDLDGNPLPLVDNGFLTSVGEGKGRFHWAQIGHGGYATSGDHHGNIDVIAENGSIVLVGGMMSNDDSDTKYNWSQIGHGGGEAQGHLGRTDETIRVHAMGASGDLLVAAGNGNRSQAHIGNGGLNFDGSHTGAIEVYAGNNIHLRGGIALDRVVKRIGEFQDMTGADGGNANDIGEFDPYYGSGGLGYVMLDAAAALGGGQKTKLIGERIQPGTVEFRLAIAAPALFDADKTPEYVDDGHGHIVETGNPANIVGEIDYATGEVTWITAILASNTANQPDVFVNYEHLTKIRNDALHANATIGHGGYASGSRVEAHPESGSGFVNLGISGNIDVRAGVNSDGVFNGSGASIIAIGGNDQSTYVQIGHGGRDSATPANHALSGNIITKADGSIVFRAGNGLIDNHHVAFNYYGTGSTEVTAVTAAINADRVLTKYATALGAGARSNSGINDVNYAYAHIGHGGVSSSANNGLNNNINDPLAATNNPATGHNGKILVETANGDISFTAGGVMGSYHFAQIGHGGVSSMGNHYGEIQVISGADINFTGGGPSYRSSSVDGRSFAQIGHGGSALTGNLEGQIEVSARGEIAFYAGDGENDYARVPYGAHVYVLNAAGNQDDNHNNRTETRINHAMIGHGGSSVLGDKTGDINVSAGNGLNFRGGDRLEGSINNNGGYLHFAQIGHGGYQSWRQYRVGNLSPDLPAAVSAADDWNLPFWWDGTQYVFDGTLGPNGDGQFFWPSDNSIDAATGRGNPLYDGFSGDINVTASGGDIRFSSGTGMGTFSHIGHGGIETGGDHNGAITVTALDGDILFSANAIEETGSSSTASNSFVQIGHGGGFSSGEQSGTIEVTASGEISFKAGRAYSFAMIGHGGRENHETRADTSGSTTYRHSSNYLLTANTDYRPGTRAGDIFVTAGGDVRLVGGSDEGDYAFVQVGHGGYRIHANPDPNSQFSDGHSGTIEVISTNGSILLQGGQKAYAHAQIGHGGTQSFGNHGGDGSDNRLKSDILVQAATGIEVKASGRFSGNSTAANFAQIGHGGRQSSFRDAEDIDANLYGKLQPYTTYVNPITGTVNADNSGMHPLTPFLNNTNATGTEGWGMGPRATLGTFMGNITVRTTEPGADIRFLAPNEAEGTLGILGSDSYVLLGHGGFRVFGDIEGDITVESAGNIEFTGLQGTGLPPNVTTNHNMGFAQLGHGGYESGGTYTGDIIVRAAEDIRFEGANSINSANAGYVQIGHGGYGTWKGTTQYREAIRHETTGVIPGEVFSVGSTGNITVSSGGNIEFLAGQDAYTYAQIGHGGRVSRDSHTGDIEVTAVGGIRFAAGVDALDNEPGANPGGNEQSHAMIGHGGYDSDGNHSGNISISAGIFSDGHEEAGQGIVFRAGAWTENFAQVGHGGTLSRTYGVAGDEVGFTGDISLTAIGDITFVGGTGNYYNSTSDGNLYARVGHGGYDADVTNVTYVQGTDIGHNGAIEVISSAGRVFFAAGDINRLDQPSVGAGEGRGHLAMIGHGGYAASGDHYGNITVSAATDVIFLGGSSEDNDGDSANSAQIGHGGYSATGNHGRADDVISVTAGRDIVFTAGNTQAAFVHLGNGGLGARGDHQGDIVVKAGGNIEFSAVQGRHVLINGDKNYALTQATEFASQGGNRYYDLEGSNVVPGTVAITIPNGPTLGDDGFGNIIVTGGDSSILSAMSLNLGEIVGSITYTTPLANLPTSPFDSGATVNGRIAFFRDVNPNDAAPSLANMVSISYESLEVNASYAQLGHGGYNADFPDGGVAGADSIGNRGNIEVLAGGDVIFKAGIGAQAYSQIGHGGYATSGRNEGDIIIGTASARIGGGVILLGGNGEHYDSGNAYVQIGHAGRSATGTQKGNISIYASTSISSNYIGAGLHVQAGSRENNYAMVGHGGTEARGGIGNDVANAEGNSGDITVDVIGDVNLIAGVLNRGGSTVAQSNGDGNLYAQIGHGGYNADVALNDAPANIHTSNADSSGHHGKIVVISREGSVNVLAGDHLREFLPSSAPAAGVYDGLTISGLTRMDAIAGGRHHYAMIGHGGMYVYGNHHGSIDVRAGFNDAIAPGVSGTSSESLVRVWGGRAMADQDESYQFAQIGNGGRSAVGNQGRATDLTLVIAVGDIQVHGGDGVDAYAIIGNGGTGSRGDHQGDIIVSAGGNLSVLGSQFSRNNPGGALETRYAHLSTTNATELNQNLDRAGLLLPVAGGLPEGRVNFRAVNGVVPGSVWIEIFNDSGVRIGTIEDDGTGTLRIVSDFTELVDGVQLTTGQEVGSVNYGANWMEFTTRVNPGGGGVLSVSDPSPNVIVNLLHTRVDRAYAQIGHGGYDADFPDGGTTTSSVNMFNAANTVGHSGNVSLFAGGDVVLKAGVGGQTYVQVGHGGMYNTGRHSGDITIGSAQARIGGGVILQGGGGDYYATSDSYVQVGHGGRVSYGTNSGDISIYANSGIAPEYEGIGLQLRAGTRNSASAQVGHGGLSSRSGTYIASPEQFVMEGHSGNVTVDVVGDVNLIAGVLNRGGAAVNQSLDDGNLYVQIGHGGYDADVSLNGSLVYANGMGHSGAIRVISQEGAVNVLAGDHLRSFLPSVAPSAGLFDGYAYQGAVQRMEAFAGGRHHYAQIGHGGVYAVGNHWGDITVHAGFNNDAIQTGNSTESSIRVWGGLSLPDNDDSKQYAIIGHGGLSAAGNLGRSGDVTSLMSAGDVEVHAGDGVDNTAQIGNGGYAARGDHSGDIQILAGGNVSVAASQFSRTQALGDGLYSRYYHVSTADAGNLNQNLDRAGLLQAVSGGNAAGLANLRAVNGVIPGSVWLEIYNDDGSLIGTIEDDGSGVLRVASNFTELVGGVQLVAGQQVGTMNYASNQILFTTRVNPGAEGGAPNVVLNLEHVRTDRAYAQIGHGGYETDYPDNDTAQSHSGDVRVTALNGNITGLSGFSIDAYVQFGHGGRSVRGANSGDVILRAGGDVDFIVQGEQDRVYIQVGHGGYDADGNHSGNVIVSAGSGALSTGMGVGLFNDLGDFDGDGIADSIQFAPVSAGQGTVLLRGGTSADSWVQIGHGGRSSGNTISNTSAMSGNIGVEANGDITLQGGIATRSFTQIGHGGWEDGSLNMSLSGDISVISQTGKLSVLAGTGSEAYSIVGHGSLRNTATSVPQGTRSGSIYVEAGSWEIVPEGTTAQARIGHRSQIVNNGLTSGHTFTMFGNGGDGTTSYTIDAALGDLIGARDHLVSGGGASFVARGNLTMGLALSYNSSNNLNLLATDDLTVLNNALNIGSGDVNLVAGWDGETGMQHPLDFLQKVPMRIFDISPVLADEESWGKNGSHLNVGNGLQNTGVAVGTAKGVTTALGHTVNVHGGASAGSYAQIGYMTLMPSSPTGGITVIGKEGGVTARGGTGNGSYAQIGHRALAAIAPNVSGNISVTSWADLELSGGSGAQSYAHLGHGGPNATTLTIGGDIDVSVSGDLMMSGGSSGGTYVQIGHGGISLNGDIDGKIMVHAGGMISLGASNLVNVAYGKIGHGDDLRGVSAVHGGTGSRNGKIEILSGGDFTLRNGLVGHVNSVSPASLLAGATTWIGVSRNSPTDPAGGSLIANNRSQIAGADVRFYLPRRENNQISAGAMINGVAYDGGVSDPWPVQRPDEYTVSVKSDSTVLILNEHDNTVGSGPIPSLGYGFYYDLMIEGIPPVVPLPPSEDLPSVIFEPTTPKPLGPIWWMVAQEDSWYAWWLRRQNEVPQNENSPRIRYEGFDQYDEDGEPTFIYRTED